MEIDFPLNQLLFGTEYLLPEKNLFILQTKTVKSRNVPSCLLLFFQCFKYSKTASKFQLKRNNHRLTSNTHQRSYRYSIRRRSMWLRNSQRSCHYNNHLRNKWSHSKFLQHLSSRTPLSLILIVTAQLDICRIKYWQTRLLITSLSLSIFTSNCNAKPWILRNSGKTNLNQIASRFSSEVYCFATS